MENKLRRSKTGDVWQSASYFRNQTLYLQTDSNWQFFVRAGFRTRCYSLFPCAKMEPFGGNIYYLCRPS